LHTTAAVWEIYTNSAIATSLITVNLTATSMLLNEQNLSKEEPMQALIFVCYSDDSGKNIPRTLL
jgi:hypothetical protein